MSKRTWRTAGWQRGRVLRIGVATLVTPLGLVIIHAGPVAARPAPCGITAAGQLTSGTEGAVLSGLTPATFTDCTASPAADYTATVDFGDGTPPSAGTVTGPVAGTYTVVAPDHTYADEGSFTTVVSITENNGPDQDTGTASATATIAEGDALSPDATQPIIASQVEGTDNGAIDVATFDNTNTSADPSDFTATIDWGDGTTPTSGTVSGGGGLFTVSGDHTYADEGSYTTTTTISDDAPGTVTSTTTNSATVTEGDTSGTVTPVDVTVAEGGALTDAIVGTFTDPGNPLQTAADWTVTIDWGDFTSSAGTVTGPADGVFTVTGSHTYDPSLDETDSPIPLVVTVTDDDPGTLSFGMDPTATITEGDTLTADASQPTITAAEGASFSGVVGNFDSTNTSAVAGDFTATIDWGDGSSPTTGTVSAGDGMFTVSGDHTYADEGSYTVAVTPTDDSPGTASVTVTNSATIDEGDVLSADATQPTIASQVEGTSSGAIDVATFDNLNGSAVASDFTATIDWGDGTTPATGTVSGAAGGPFTVSGTHTYADEGPYTTSVTISDDAPGTATSTTTNSVTVAEGDFGVITVAHLSVAEGGVLSEVTVGTFTDPGNPSQTAADWTASIDWGDATTSAGTVTGPTGGPYTVTGSHTYDPSLDETASPLPVVVTMTDNSPSALTFTIDSTVNITEGDTLTADASQPTIAPAEGVSFSGVVGNFDSTNTSAVAGDFTATIDWGDGSSPTTGTVSAGDGMFTVSGGPHVYFDETSATITVTVTEDSPGTASVTITNSASIGEGDTLSGDATQPTIASQVEGTSSGATDVATFDTTNATAVVGDFTATIDWGDGSPATLSTVTGPVGGPFTVSGAHTYFDEGVFTVTATITDDTPGTATSTTTNSVTVGEADTLTADATQPPITGVAGSSFSGPVGVFDDTYAGNSADFSATINWGDATTTAGTVTGVVGGPFTVSGIHTYAAAGTPTVTVTLTDDGSGTATATRTTTASVTAPAPGGGGGGGGGTPTTTPMPPTITRDQGGDRVATAVAVSQSDFGSGAAGAVVLARSDVFADALAGTPLAIAKHAPLLITSSSALDPRVLTEIERVLPAGGTVYVLGGTDAISVGVTDAVTAAGFHVIRYSGLNRFGTAVDIANRGLGDPKVVVEATGLDFPDALTAGAVAAQQHGAVLLTNGASQASETAAFLIAHPPTSRFAVGGPAAAADPGATAFVGGDRYGTAADVATSLFPHATAVGLATGLAFPDALAGSVDMAGRGGPLLLVPATLPLPESVTTYLGSLTGVTGIVVYGGVAAVPDAVVGGVESALG